MASPGSSKILHHKLDCLVKKAHGVVSQSKAWRFEQFGSELTGES